MGRYSGPKGRVNRRIGVAIFENAGAVKALERRDTPPGQYGKRKKPTDYGLGLTEKQKVKYHYGMRDEQLRRFFERARSITGNTGANLMILCEQRLDNAVARAGFTVTRLQARQGVVHRHFQVNGKTVDRPSYQVRPGDVITIRNRPNLKKFYDEIAGRNHGCDWISFDKDSLTATIKASPTMQDVALPIEIGRLVTFLNR